MDADDSEAESEGEELRKAARAFAAASKQSKAEPDVIVLDDSSDDDAAAAPPAQPAGAPRYVWPTNGTTASQPTHRHHQPEPQRLSQSQLRTNSQGPCHDAVPNRLHAAASAVNAGLSSSPQSSWGQASSSRQHPAAQQTSSSATANGSISNGPLRIKLPTRPLPAERQQPAQQASRLACSSGLHPATSTSSGSQLADAAARAITAQHQQQQHQARQLPTSLLGKRKQQDLNGHNGAYSQAAAQASGMSTLDQMHRAADRSAELRHPQPYSANMNGYGMPAMYAQAPYSPSYWQPQVHGNPAVTSSPYSAHAIGSPGYSSGYSGLPSMQEQHSNVADAAALQAPMFGLTEANQLLPDGEVCQALQLSYFVTLLLHDCIM